MSFSMHIHPRDHQKIEGISAKVHGSGSGNCVNLHIDGNTFHLHYGDPVNRYEFVSKLKEVIAALPNECPACGKDE